MARCDIQFVQLVHQFGDTSPTPRRFGSWLSAKVFSNTPGEPEIRTRKQRVAEGIPLRATLAPSPRPARF